LKVTTIDKKVTTGDDDVTTGDDDVTTIRRNVVTRRPARGVVFSGKGPFVTTVTLFFLAVCNRAKKEKVGV
jgi:hypothetical protein